MVRLTLNVLLSLAQFEREVIGQRVRDKIAASKRKGLGFELISTRAPFRRNASGPIPGPKQGNRGALRGIGHPENGHFYPSLPPDAPGVWVQIPPLRAISCDKEARRSVLRDSLKAKRPKVPARWHWLSRPFYCRLGEGASHNICYGSMSPYTPSLCAKPLTD
jgi:hypothetical protein